jgi:DNA-binding CsgD family transcriptional regulator
MSGSPTKDNPNESVPLPPLSPARRWIVRTVAVAGRSCELWFVERMVDRSGPSLVDDVEALMTDGLLVDTGDGVAPASTAVRDAVLGSVPRSVLGVLYERTATIMAGVAPSIAAGHLLHAIRITGRVDVDLVSELAASPSIDASVCADLLIAARTRCGPALEARRRSQWLLAAVDHLMLAGRSRRAVEVISEEIAADRAGSEQRALLLGRLGAWHATEQPSRALDCLYRALAQDRIGPEHRSWLLTTQAFVAGRIGHPDVDGMLREARQAQATSQDPGCAIRLTLARSTRALSQGDVLAARLLLAQLDPSAPAARTQAALIRAERIVVQLALGEFDDARAAVQAALDEVGTFGADLVPMLSALACLLLMAVGELPEAEARAGLMLRQADGQLTDEVRAALLAVVVEARFRGGRQDAARELVHGEYRDLRWPDSMPWMMFCCAAAGDPDPARRPGIVRAAVTGLAGSLRPLVLLPQQAARLVRAALRLGDVARARTVARYTATVAGRTPTPLWRGIAGHASGLVERDPAAVREAIGALRATGVRPALADALLDLAHLPRVSVAEAKEAAQESAALFGRIGAMGDQERAQRRENALASGRCRSAAGRPAQGFEALTSREVRVAELLAAGATKQQAAARLFVSFHTVDTQLRSIYAKLGISSRVQLARAWDARKRRPDAA